MKKIILAIIISASLGQASAQEFTKQLNTARTAYSAGKLEDARFAMQQMMQELDIMTGKEVLALLPQKMDTLKAQSGKDNVSGASGFVGVVIHREYGVTAMGGNPPAEIEVITNSPIIGSLNTLLSLPLIGNSPDQKVVKIAGYKAMVTKQGNDGAPEYEVQLPLNNTLITLKAPGLTQDKIIALANTLPVAEIAKKVQ